MKQLLLLPALITFLTTGLNQSQKTKAERVRPAKENHSNQNVMQSQSYTTTILVPQDAKTAFTAIKNFRAWWSEDIDGETDKLGNVFLYHYKDVHICKMKLIEVVPNKRLVYQVLDNQFSFTKDKTEWVGTKLIFDVSKEGDQTKITFTHEGLVPAYECYKVCYDAWGNYIKNSLFSLITTGKGSPNPKDKDGFNAELADKWKIKH
jgi:uncharacterized protein YndB with AHSA1/START domain